MVNNPDTKGAEAKKAAFQVIPPKMKENERLLPVSLSRRRDETADERCLLSPAKGCVPTKANSIRWA
ncbi:hypothetical protein LFML04_0147 [Leptospirillum ferriphilum ML-04]|jgi:hypothetical protein|uniref:Uncharacterized protein n=1 Tax=Leptospirillum ferriphilum (strain ML-04) TaxID=1048260 RepID=J9Z7M2_LEPFM|nr:hypothetical protein LFML04_0147 [Leptospirillum ferriphilum ML-04]